MSVNYKPLIDNMQWSYSRVGSFWDCPKKWYLKYIKHLKEDEMFYASYGTFIHKLIEKFYRGEITKDQMLSEYLEGFLKEVKGKRPDKKILQNYISSGTEYLKSFEPFPFNMVEVEMRVDFDIDGITFCGYIDYLGEKDGEYYVVDNKSRNLKPRSGRSVPTLKDKELDSMLKQLYLYSAAVYQKYGKYPKSLCFNCFKAGIFIEEPFRMEAYEAARQWIKDSVAKIREEQEFPAVVDQFSCKWLCGFNADCREYREEIRSKWRKR